MARSYLPVAIDRAVRARARYQCEPCRSPEDMNTDPFSIEHIYPVSLGGTSDESNLALACLGCNLAKDARVEGLDSVTNLRVALFNPRVQRWSEHFEWSENYQQVEPRTPVGRVTLLVLDLNRRKVCNLRRVLVNSELHPPDDE